MRIIRTPRLAQWVFPRRQWHGPRQGVPTLYLTFDDGPTPGVTDFVMDQLEAYGGRGTFFVVGQQAERHPELLIETEARGHRLGNHSHTHRNGYKTASADYLADIQRAQASLGNKLATPPELFRPPYGRLRSRDARILQRDFKIVMWEVLAYDWRKDLSPEAVAQNVIAHGRPGSIVVMHDSQKAEKNIKAALPLVLDHFSQKGFSFAALP